MLVTFHPRGSAPTEWQYDKDDVLGTHCEMIEKRFGQTWERFNAAVASGSMKARRVLLWYLHFLDHPTYTMRDVPDFRAGELRVEQSAAEIVLTIDRVRKLKPLDEEDARENEQILNVLGLQLTEAREREGIEDSEGESESDDPAPKDSLVTPPPEPSIL